MALTSQVKEEFYIRRVFDGETPLFVDITRYLRAGSAYELSAKKALKATCAVRTDNEVVAFSLRNYTARQAEKEIENVEYESAGRTSSRNLLRPHMPRRVLHGLNEKARALAGVLGDSVVVELGEELYTMSLTRVAGDGRLELTGRLTESPEGYTVAEPGSPDVEFELPPSGLRMRVFLRSPVRDRILAYAFHGYLTRKPGERETLTRAAALALNAVLGLATFRLLSRLDRIDVPRRPRVPAGPVRGDDDRTIFTVPVVLFSTEGVALAYGDVTAELDLDHVDPVTGGLRFELDGSALTWNPDAAGAEPDPASRFAPYTAPLATAISAVLQSLLGEQKVQDIAYDILLSDLSQEAITTVREAVAGFPSLVATPLEARVQAARTPNGLPA